MIRNTPAAKFASSPDQAMPMAYARCGQHTREGGGLDPEHAQQRDQSRIAKGRPGTSRDSESASDRRADSRWLGGRRRGCRR